MQQGTVNYTGNGRISNTGSVLTETKHTRLPEITYCLTQLGLLTDLGYVSADEAFEIKRILLDAMDTTKTNNQALVYINDARRRINKATAG